MTWLDYVWVFLGFVLFLFAVGAKFELAGRDFGFKTDQTLPLWDRMVAGSVGIIPLSLELYRAVTNLSPLRILPWASAAAITLSTVAYLLALWWHGWNEDRKGDKLDGPRKRIRIVLLLMIFVPLVFLLFLLPHQLIGSWVPDDWIKM